MKTTFARRAAGVLAGGVAAGAAAYCAYAGVSWLRYGHASVPRNPEEKDGLLDGFMPLYDVVERHHVTVKAPAELALATACSLDIAWTLRADPTGERSCVFRTETRALATDNLSRERFRRYWALVSPGVVLVRVGMLMPVKRVSEWKARAA